MVASSLDAVGVISTVGVVTARNTFTEVAAAKVVPVTLSHARLMAELENGQIIKGETNIDIPKHDGRLRMKKVWLKPRAIINPTAKNEILNADLVIIGPGDLYSSLVPNLLVGGMGGALNKTKAKVAYFVNLMTKFGETNGFSAPDFIKTIQDYLGKKELDFAIINSKKPSPKRLSVYIKEQAEFVEPDLGRLQLKKVTPIVADVVRSKGFIRHDPEKLAKVVKMII